MVSKTVQKMDTGLHDHHHRSLCFNTVITMVVPGNRTKQQGRNSPRFISCYCNGCAAVVALHTKPGLSGNCCIDYARRMIGISFNLNTNVERLKLKARVHLENYRRTLPYADTHCRQNHIYLRLFISWSSVERMRTPIHPSGWPMQWRHRLHLLFSRSSPRSCMQAIFGM